MKDGKDDTTTNTMLQLLSIGSNSHNQLGQSSHEDSHELRPTLWSGDEGLPSDVKGIKSLVFGSNHTLALLSSQDGGTSVWVSGNGTSLPPYQDAGKLDGFRQIELGAPYAWGWRVEHTLRANWVQKLPQV